MNESPKVSNLGSQMSNTPRYALFVRTQNPECFQDIWAEVQERAEVHGIGYKPVITCDVSADMSLVDFVTGQVLPIFPVCRPRLSLWQRIKAKLK